MPGRPAVDAAGGVSYKQSVTSQVAACANHPEREAIGICVRCRIRVCSECSTKVDGINYCVSCLAGLAVSSHAAARREGEPSSGNAYVSAGVYFVVLSALIWMFLQVTLPEGPF